MNPATMEGRMEPSLAPEQDPAPSTSREMMPIVFIKQEIIDDSDDAMEKCCINAGDVLVKMEAYVDVKVECDTDAPNTAMEQGEMDVKLEDFIKEKKKTKTKNQICKSKSTEKGDLLTDDEYINSNITQVTITDAEREDEHRMNLAKRNHYRFKCETCACGFVARKAYDKHMVLHSPESGDYQCSICYCHLRTPVLHYQHRLRHFRRYKCALCTDIAPLKEKEAIASHIRKEHLRTGFPCQRCCKVFKRSTYLKLHEDQIHNKSTEFPCPVCNRVYYQKNNLRVHVRTHDADVKTRSEVFICDICQCRFSLKTSLSRHMTTAHAAHEAVACDTCHKLYKSRQVLKKHVGRDHSAVPIDKELCNICNKYFSTKALLRFHNRRMHMEQGKRFECDDCKKRFMTKGEIRDHIETVHVAIRDKVCQQCGKGFTTNFLLNRHTLSHSGKRYPCNSCDRTFRSLRYVDFHFKLKHLNMTRAQIRNEKNPGSVSKDGRELCTICHKYLSTPALLRHHVRRMHMEEGKRFQCDICKKRFMTKVEVRDHIENVHVAIRDKVCIQCGKWFTTNYHLYRHTKYSHGGKKYPCKSCDRTFGSLQYVDFHYKVKHMNMTREEIRNEKKARIQNLTDDYSEISPTIVQRFHALASSEGSEILGT